MEKIDNYRDNWWCSFAANYRYFYNRYWSHDKFPDHLSLVYPDGEPVYPDFLSAVEREQARQEWSQMQQIGPAPNHLSRVVIEYAKNHPNDPRVPEALHRAVKATRYGCTDDETTHYSKEAYVLLHNRYPKSIWAKRTKYWY